MIPISAADMLILDRLAWKLERYSSLPDADQFQLKQLIATVGLVQTASGRIKDSAGVEVARGYSSLINRRKAIFKENSND